MRTLKIDSLKSTKDGWVDRDMIMLHACFQLLVDFVEKEDGLKHCNYEHHKKEIDKLQKLYDWWQKEKDTVDFQNTKAQKQLVKLIKMRYFLWT